MPISAVDSISLVFEHTKKQLVQPFRFGQWVKLAFVGLLAGEVGSTGGCNFSNFKLPHQPTASRYFVDGGFSGIDPALLGALIAVLVGSALILGVIFMYISSVMRFVLFDSIIAKECRIGEGWGRRQRPGWRLFLFRLVFAFVALGGLGVLIGIPAAFAYSAGLLREPSEHLAPLILGGVVLFFLLLIFSFGCALVYVLTKDFVVPQMALEGIGAVEAWRRLWQMIQNEKGGYAGYIGMKIVLAIAAGIMVGIVTLILGLIIAIPTVGLSIIAIMTGKTAGLTWNVYTITLAVVVGAVLLAIFMFIVSLVAVPVVVFFPAYSIYFFASRYPALSVTLNPPAVAPTGTFGVPVIPPEPPPLPPAPAPAG